MKKEILDKVESQIEVVMDFPVKGIAFRDITPLFKKPDLVKEIIKEFVEFAKEIKADVILGPESRGFLFGLPTALESNLPFGLVRKGGKLPRKTVSQTYTLEYGTSEFFLHVDVIKPGQKVLIIDDLLATGGTTNCIEKLITQLGGEVAGSAYLIGLNGLLKHKLSGKVFTLIQY